MLFKLYLLKKHSCDDIANGQQLL